MHREETLATGYKSDLNLDDDVLIALAAPAPCRFLVVPGRGTMAVATKRDCTRHRTLLLFLGSSV
jgi:hypothetical protein